jgi:hypothetical protein
MFSDPVKQFFDAAYGALNELPNRFHNALDVDELEAFCTQRRRELETHRRVVLCACEDSDTELKIRLDDGLGAVVEDVVKLLDLAVAGRTRLDDLYLRCQADPSLFSTWGQEKEARGRRLEQIRQTALETVQNLFRAVSGTLGSPAREQTPASPPASESGEPHAILNDDPTFEEGSQEQTDGKPSSECGGTDERSLQSGEDGGNDFRLTGAVWHIRFEEGGENGDFPDRQDSILRHLARLLAEPNHRFPALEFFPQPPGAAPLPHLGRDANSDSRALLECEGRMRRLVQEIKDASDARDTETVNKLRNEFERLAEHVNAEKAARKHGHKRMCGTLSPAEKADQALRVGLERLKKRFQQKGLPKLADHLHKYLCNTACVWWYAPPPGTSPWHVTRPDPSSPDRINCSR